MKLNNADLSETERPWRIGIFGTFDVQNYGDLLFPIIAKLELSKRLENIELVVFSYHNRSTPDWPYDVVTLADLPKLAAGLDAMLIGGGFLVRFDKFIAPAYEPPVPWIQHPTGYWLTPALIGAQHGIPVIWNAPGMHCNHIPAWSHPLLSLALKTSTHVAVRDEPTKIALTKLAGENAVNVMPDTAFSIKRLLDSNEAIDQAQSIRDNLGLKMPYVVIQATQNLERFTDHIKRYRSEVPDLSFLILRIGPVLHDHESFIDRDLPSKFVIEDWPSPLVAAALIAGSDAVVGHSYHLAITAISCGIPVFSSSNLEQGKFTAISAYEGVYPLPPAGCEDPHWLSQRIGRRNPSASALKAGAMLDTYWDRVADIVRGGKTDSPAVVNAFWMSLPEILEKNSIESENETGEEGMSMHSRELLRIKEASLHQALKELKAESENSRRLGVALSDMRHSLSWRLMAPVRHALDWLRSWSA